MPVEAGSVRILIGHPQDALDKADLGQPGQRVLNQKPANAQSLSRRHEVYRMEFADIVRSPISRATEGIADRRAVALRQP